MSLWLF